MHVPARLTLSCSFLCLALLLNGPALAMEQDSDYDPPSYRSSYSGSASTNAEVRLSAVEDQVRALTGKVEQIDFALRRIEQNLQREQSDTDMRLGKIESAVRAGAIAPPTAPSVAANPAASDEDEDVTGTLGALKTRDGTVTGGINKPKAPALPATAADYGLSAQEQYDRAFSLLRAASYDDAEKAFKAFIDKNPKDKLIDNAKYWYAETYYVRGKFGDAAVAFAEAYETSPKSTKAPDTLLKLAMSLGSLGKTQDACATLGALKAKFPTAPATIRARADQERTHLKCKG